MGHITMQFQWLPTTVGAHHVCAQQHQICSPDSSTHKQYRNWLHQTTGICSLDITVYIRRLSNQVTSGNSSHNSSWYTGGYCRGAMQWADSNWAWEAANTIMSMQGVLKYCTDSSNMLEPFTQLPQYPTQHRFNQCIHHLKCHCKDSQLCSQNANYIQDRCQFWCHAIQHSPLCIL